MTDAVLSPKRGLFSVNDLRSEVSSRLNIHIATYPGLDFNSRNSFQFYACRIRQYIQTNSDAL